MSVDWFHGQAGGCVNTGHRRQSEIGVVDSLQALAVCFQKGVKWADLRSGSLDRLTHFDEGIDDEFLLGPGLA